MRPRVHALLLIPSIIAIRSAGAAPVLRQAHQRILVYDLEADGVDETLARNLSRLFTFGIRRAAGRREVLGSWEINNLLRLEGQKALLGCTGGESCLADIAGALGAQVLATGVIGRIGDPYLVDLRLIDVTEARVLRQVSEQIVGSEEMVAEALEQLTRNLLDPEIPTRQAILRVHGHGTVTVDGTPAGQAPISRLLVAPGDHLLLWQPRAMTRPTGELSLRVEPYTEVDARPHPRQVHWDLKGLYASNAIGVAPGVEISSKARTNQGSTGTDGTVQKISQTSLVYRFRIGWMFPEGLGIHFSHHLEAGPVALNMGTIGVGYRAGGLIRFHLAADLAGGVLYDEAHVISPNRASNTAGLLLSGEATYTVDRYLELGLSISALFAALDVTRAGTTERLSLSSGSFLLLLGLPPWTPTGAPQQVFWKSRSFWVMAAATVAGGILSNVLLDPLRKLQDG